MKNLKILIELVGDLRTENAILKESNEALKLKAEEEVKTMLYWFDKFKALETENALILTTQN